MSVLDDSVAAARFDEKRAFFASGATRPAAFRERQLLALDSAIRRREDEIVAALRGDFGKPPFESYMTEIGILYEEIRYARRRLRSWSRPRRLLGGLSVFPTRFEVRYEPKGVALIVGPWNYPFQLAMAPLVASIAAGCCAVVKPSHVTARVSAVIEELVSSTFPPEYISAVPGPGSTTVPALMSSYRFDHVFFTGSPSVGKSVAKAAADSHSSVTLELGGKSPAIVAADADLRDAARRIMWAKCVNAGQTCVAPDYAIVDASVKDEFVARCREALLEYFGDDPAASPDLARVVNDRRFDTVCGYLDGASVLVGGRVDRTTRFIEPTIIDEPSPDSAVMREEIFGPVLPVLSFSGGAGDAGSDAVKAIIERNSHPLALYLFGRNRAFAEAIVGGVRFGGGCVGNALVHLADPRVPFGGTGSSGLGNYHGRRGFEAFSHEKTIAYSGRKAFNAFAFPPYTDRKASLVRRLMD